MKFLKITIMGKRLILLSFFLFNIFIVYASNLRLPSVIGDHMVLQQKSSVSIWGWAQSGSKVSVKASWLSKSVDSKADGKGKWELRLPTPIAGGPYEIKIKSDTVIVLRDILIGEVWVCSGQSNMAMTFKGYRNCPVNGE